MDELTALKLQLEWGADELLDADPVNRLRAPLPRPEPIDSVSSPAAPSVLRAPPTPAGAPGRASARARACQAALAAGTLAELRAVMAAFDGCALRNTATSLVFAEGDPAAGLLLIADPPSSDDDRAGRPLTGAVGLYFDKMLASIALDRARLLLAPLIPWRPPGDRPPSPTEIAICLPFLYRLIALTGPRRLVLLGSLPVRALLGAVRRTGGGGFVEVAIPDLGGPAHRAAVRGGAIPDLDPKLPGLATFSPARLLREPASRRAAWADLRLLRRSLDTDLAHR